MGNTTSYDEADSAHQVRLRDFELGQIIGKGTFGRVRIVTRKDTRKQYACKYISKAYCKKTDTAINIIRERDILEEVDHSFVCNLRYVLFSLY